MKRAFAMAEMLVVIALFGILVMLVATFLSRVFRFSYVNLRESARLQRSQILYAHLLQDLRKTTSAAVSWHPDLNAATIQPLETISASGRPVYSANRLILYRGLPSLQRVIRKQFEDRSLPIEEPKRLSAGETRALFDLPGAAQESYSEIVEFDLGSSLGGGNLSSPLHPRLLIRYERTYGQPQQVQLELKQEFYLPSCP